MRKPSTQSQPAPIAYRPRSSAPCAVISISMLIRSLAGTTWPRYFQVPGWLLLALISMIVTYGALVFVGR
jgi:hypothetical protein